MGVQQLSSKEVETSFVVFIFLGCKSVLPSES